MVVAFLIIFLLVIIAAVVYVFLIMPRAVEGADMDMLSCEFAHRGLWNEKYPENSLAAFELAARAGYGIELDIQLSKDKKVVVFHDTTLKRMCGIDRKVCDLTLADLKKLTLLGTEYRIPTLSEVLDLIDGRVPLLVELKGEDLDTTLCGVCAKLLDDYRGVFCVESFNPIMLSWFKSYRPRYARGQLVTNLMKERKNTGKLLSFCLSHMLLNFLSRPDFIAIDKKYQGKLAFKICTGLFRAKAFVWTVKRPQEYIDAHKSGKYTIFERIRP